jgi:hypothetical protein
VEPVDEDDLAPDREVIPLVAKPNSGIDPWVFFSFPFWARFLDQLEAFGPWNGSVRPLHSLLSLLETENPQLAYRIAQIERLLRHSGVNKHNSSRVSNLAIKVIFQRQAFNQNRNQQIFQEVRRHS